MHRLLIVDDEKNIRLGIQAMINREFPDQFSTTVAMDGQGALEITKNNPIDIMITDIKMPRMDGIMLIQHLQELEQKPSLIILSGFDDFEYARAAINYKVNDYLLKPINRTELFQSLTKVVKELEFKNESENQRLNEYRTSQLNYLLLNPNIEKDEIKKICEELQIQEYEKGYYVGIVENKRGVEDVEYLFQLRKQCRTEASQMISFYDKNKHLVVMIPAGPLFENIKLFFQENKYDQFSFAVSEKLMEIKQLKVGYEQASQAHKYRFLFPRKQVLLYDDVKRKPKNPQLPVATINKISNMLGTERERELKLTLLELFDFDEIASFDITYMESLSELMNANVFDSFFNKLGNESIEIFRLYNYVGDLYHFQDFHDYYYAVEDLIMRLHEYVKQIKSVYSEQKYMEKAIQYIEENYYKDLNLAVVSNYVSLNYSYFSHSFKEYTGHNFVDYLKKVRIREAKKLLVNTDHKVFEISDMVGYKNPKQFARVFRELEGISPKEYREQTESNVSL